MVNVLVTYIAGYEKSVAVIVTVTGDAITSAGLVD